uniref:NADH-ubiquinone oxidoreductase chain 1 n=1 Tax=Thaumastocoris safordi TaxID=1589682 RepID=A0A8T9ZXV6_9HEMI|nr:NADH dehydrogenase subunit 1 [Thaumastocoris safordi]
MMYLNYVVVLVMVLVSVVFVTLLERNILGYIQFRKGPNMVGVMGIMQPFADGLKLFLKEQTWPFNSNNFIYFITPIFMFSLALIMWVMYPFLYNNNFSFNFMFFMCCAGMGVYGTLISGWSSNSSYSLLGGLRALAQTISYEVSMALIMISPFLLAGSLSFFSLFKHQMYIWYLFMFPMLFFCWLASCLAETNRTPFDFAEGESELVSGFNVEYSSGGFAFISLAEYTSIIFMSMLTVILFLGGSFNSPLFYFMSFFLVGFFIWTRGTLPRFRYDKLMYLTWKQFLPLSLMYLIFIICVIMLSVTY